MSDTARPLSTRRNLAILIAAQAIPGAQLPMIFIVAGLIGTQISPIPCLATLPITMLVAGSMLAATPMSALMQRHGRRAGFLIGTGAGAAGAAIGALGLWTQNFWILSAGSLLTGVYMSAQGFYRFAAADSASESFRSRAISYVLAGGLVSALIGPQLVKLTFEASVIAFFGTYVAAILLNLIGAAFFLFLDIPKPVAAAEGSAAGRSRMALLKTPVIGVSILSAMVAYALMNLVMTATPIAVVGCGYTTANASDVVMAHVLAMYVPSFFTGHVIARIGARATMALGLVFLAMAGGVALAGVDLVNFFGALILLGLGWNFGFIGATTLLTTAHSDAEKGRVQGLNDMLVMGAVTVASLASGGLMNCSGSSAIAGWTTVNLAMIPALSLAGAALVWLALTEWRARQAASRI